jgi:hypothetical protein
MEKLVALLSLMLCVNGCRAAVPAASSASSTCPVPKSERESLVLGDDLLLFVDEWTRCMLWKPNEGDGHVARLLSRDGSTLLIEDVRLDDEMYAAFIKKDANWRNRHPKMAPKKIWILCRSVKAGESL